MGQTYDGFVRTDGDQLWDRIRAAHARFAEVAGSVPPDLRADGSDWTAQQVTAHVLTVLRRYTERDFSNPTGLSDDAGEVARQNAVELAPWAAVPVVVLLDDISATLDRLEAVFPRSSDLHQVFPFHGGQQLDGAAALGNLIGEFLLHGRDIARAARVRWPVDGHDAALVLNLGMQVSPGFVAPDGPGDLKVEVRTPHSRPWILDLADGELESRPRVKGEPVDVRMYGRSQAILLNLYGRIGIVGATFRGTTVIGGRRPWRLARLPKAFVQP